MNPLLSNLADGRSLHNILVYIMCVRKAAEPGAVALPVKPVQLVGQFRRRDIELDRVIETAAMHGPQFTGHALLLQVFILCRRQAAVQKDKVKGRADPGDGRDDVNPAQQQIRPVEVITFHESLLD